MAITDSGDVTRVLRGCAAGVLVESLDDAELERAARALHVVSSAPATRDHARRTAIEWFSLEAGVRGYDRVYQRVVSGDRAVDQGWPNDQTRVPA